MECLVTKLKGNVTASLPKLNTLLIKVHATGVELGKRQAVIGCANASDDNPFTIRVVSGEAKISTNEDLSNPFASRTYTSKVQYKYFYFLEGEYEVEIESKYELDDFVQGSATTTADSSWDFDISQLAWCTKLSRFLIMYDKKITGDIASLSKSVNLTNLDLTGCSIYGDISSIATLTKVGKLNLYGNAGLTGTIEEFANALHDNGKLSGTISCDFRGTGISYQGELIATSLTITFSASGYSIA